MITKVYIAIFFSFILTSANTAKQKPDVNDIDLIHSYLKNLEFEKARQILKKSILNTNEEDCYLYLIELYESNAIINSVISKSCNLESNVDSPLNYLILGYKKLNSSTNRHQAFEEFKKSYELSKTINNNALKKASLIGILKVFKSNSKLEDERYIPYLETYKNLIEDNTDLFWAIYYQIILEGKATKYDPSKHLNEKSFKRNITKLNQSASHFKNNNRITALINMLNGDYYAKHNGEIAKKYYQVALNALDSSLYFNQIRFSIKIDLARSEAFRKNYKEAINIIHSAKKDLAYGSELKNKLNYSFFLSECYSKLKQFDSAYFYKNKESKLVKDANFEEHHKALASLESQLGTAEKEKENLILKEQKSKNKNIALGLAGLLVFGGITFMLIQKNTKRKQLLAEQEKELQTQKLATVLKEQELTSIDAMIAGQEKERQRIANDLHDDLGGLMATVKLHFNALKEKQSPELFDKTTKLLDKAYDKVRTVAHTKNSGVMAKKGLLKAINDMARTVSASNKLVVDVIDHGLENRLENSLELTIFRIIQELITNVIKHANATEATIHITNHDDSLNIMIEDNGKGFNTKKIKTSSGMGIHSIDKRIENLGGSVTIESEDQKGTTVIIDIPS